MKKILLIGNYKYGHGGISGQMEILYKNLNSEGINCEIFNTSGNYVQRLLMFPKLIRMCKSYDVLHVHACSYLGFFPIVLSVLVNSFLNKNLILTYHGGDAGKFFAKYPGFVKYFLNRTDQNIVLSGFLEKEFHLYGLKYKVIPNVVENSFPFREKKELSPNYISVRSLYKLYNIECIIKAFQLVVDVIPYAKLTILGDGPDKSRLESFVNAQKIANIHFVGRVRNEMIYNYLNQSDVFVSAPRIDNMPVSIIEAFNAGLLVISSRVGGVPYMVSENVNGYLFKDNDYIELAGLMLKSVQNQEDSLAIIRAAKSEAAKYKWENIKNELLTIYGI
jgi:glycosyltransferase involved in cell wall biosynthesis